MEARFSLACTLSNDILIHQIVGGNEDGVFRIDIDSGHVYLTKSVDYEIKPVYNLRIAAFDNELSGHTEVQINVLDINEEPVVQNITSVYIQEDAISGTVAQGVINFYDHDQGQYVRAKVVPGKNSFTSKGTWLFGSYRLQLQFNSTDDNVILGRWINHNRPQFHGILQGRNGTMYFPEDSQAHTFSLDADYKTIRWGSGKEWTLLYGSILQKIIFDIQPFSGKVYLSQGSLNYEHDQQYTLPVAFYDSDKNDQKSVERLVSIIVTNVNEIPLFGGSANFENNIAKYEFSVEEEIDSVIKPGSWVERGGYKDTSDTALRYGPHQYGYTAATCQTACQDWNGKVYKYFALQNNGWCSCDNDWNHITKYGQKSCGKTGGPFVQLCL